MERKEGTLLALSMVLMIVSVLASGCFDTGTAKRIIFPDDERPIRFVQGTIALVSHNFTGPIYSENVTVGGPSYHNGIDNFIIGEGGANLSIFALIHFIPDPQPLVEGDDRYVEIRLVPLEGENKGRSLALRTYNASGGGKDIAEVVKELSDVGPGLYSLRVVGKGTAQPGTSQYDWFKVFVLGRYSDRSHNHNAPSGSNLP